MKTTSGPISEESSLQEDPTVNTKDEILEEAKTRFKDSVSFESDNRDLAEDDVDFRHGDQWPDSIRTQRENDARPCLTFNKMEERVDQVVGDQRQAKVAIAVHPADITADAEALNRGGERAYKLSETMNGLIRSIEQASDAQIAYNTGFDHAAGHGFGYWRIITQWSVHNPFSQEILIRRIKNAFSVYFDPLADEPHGGDANYCFVSTMMNRKVFERKYPDAVASSWPQSGKGDENELWYNEDNVRIVEYFRRVPKKTTAFLLSNGSIAYVDDDNLLEPFEDSVKAKGLRVQDSKKVEVPKVEWYKLSPMDILEKPREFPSMYIPVIRCIGKELNVNGYSYYRGVIRHAKDAQRMYNFNRTAQVEQTSLQPKAPYLATAEQIGAYKSAWDRVNKDNLPFLLYEHVDGVPMPQRQPPPLPSQASMLNAQSDDADIDATTGLHKASIGATSNEKSGRAIRERKMEGDVATYAYHDNFNQAIKQTGRVLVDMIPRVYDSTRTERIVTPEDEEDYVELNKKVIGPDGKITLVNDIGAAKYDVRISAGPSYTTLREEARLSMLDFAQAMPQVGALIADMIAENMDWPKADAVAERIKKTLPPGIADDRGEDKQEITEQDVQMAVEQAVQQALQQSDALTKQMQTQIDAMSAKSKADTDEYNAITNRMKVLEGAMDDKERIRETVAESIAELMQENI